MINDTIFNLILIVGLWIFCSLCGSTVKLSEMNCGKTYAIDYVLFNNAFCEIKSEDNDQ